MINEPKPMLIGHFYTEQFLYTMSHAFTSKKLCEIIAIKENKTLLFLETWNLLYIKSTTCSSAGLASWQKSETHGGTLNAAMAACVRQENPEK